MIPRIARLILAALLLGSTSWTASTLKAQGQNPYADWPHSGSLFILTTPEGADLPASAREEGFPLLVVLSRDLFPFAQAKPDGDDIRFSTSQGEPLAYQVEHWNGALGSARIWVRLPIIRGNTRQELRLHWGKTDAPSESNGSAVFNASNGYASVWHMSEPVRDEVGTLESNDTGTTPTQGVIDQARHFPGGRGIFGGDKIPDYPSGAGPHTTEAWFRSERPNATIIGWGNEGGGRGSKIRMQFRSPPHIHIDSDFSDVRGTTVLPMGEWVHVAHTYGNHEGKIYINGRLDGSATPTLDIKSPARLWIGGWYDNYDFVGDIDEVRVSRVARSADWVKLVHENQKPLPTLVGPLVQPGAAFSVEPAMRTVLEGQHATFRAQAGGAQRVEWIRKRAGVESVVAVNRFTFPFEAGRVSGDTTATLLFKAVYPDRVETREIPITIQEDIPEPVFTLDAPATWDGRTPIEVVPRIANARAMEAKHAGKLDVQWSLADIAVTRDTTGGKLHLTRAQHSGTLTVTATVSNGGAPSTQAVDIVVTEPARDAWVERTPAPDEKPVDHQFYARDDQNRGTLVYNGTLDEPADAVFLRVTADGKPYVQEKKPLAADRSYAFSIKLEPGLVHYSVQFGCVKDGRETVQHTVDDIVCGDAYLIQGQSNAVATDWGDAKPTYHSEWIRTFGSMSGSPEGVKLWGEAVHRGHDTENLQIGYWGMELGRRLVENHKIPICILNGAVGGTRIDQHQRNRENPEDMNTIYGRLLWRVRQAGLSHGIRGIFWHQGENDQGADGPTGGFGWETYRQYFIDLAAAWKEDYPNVQHYYVFQIWPKACAMGFEGSDNRLREVQRNLPTAFSHLSVMSTLGIDPPGGCHYPAAGYAEFARLIAPLVERDNYGVPPATSITPPNLLHARFTSEARDAIALAFDQPVNWDDTLASEFTLDGKAGLVARGSVSGKVITLKLRQGSNATNLTYLDSKAWSQERLIRGTNGLAALTFCEVPIRAPRPAE